MPRPDQHRPQSPNPVLRPRIAPNRGFDPSDDHGVWGPIHLHLKIHPTDFPRAQRHRACAIAPGAVEYAPMSGQKYGVWLVRPRLDH